MALTTILWKNFKAQPEIWFFYGFLLTFTLTIRKVLWFLPLRGEFNEYAGTYLYLSDIFLVLTIIAWIYTILYNKISILSIYRNIFFRKTECSTLAPCCENVPRGTLLIPLILISWSFISLIWAENKMVAIFRSVKILEFYLLYVFILTRFFYEIVPRGTISYGWNNLQDKRRTWFRKIFGLTMIIGLFQAIIGIFQFILQHSIGLFWLKESLISPNIAGVAKIIFNGETFIRAYGLFPHPNILGGFLMFSIFVSLLYYKMFYVEQNGQNKNVPRGTLIRLFLGIQLLGLILTFSKSAILGLFLGLIYYAYTNVPRGTFVSYLRKKKRLIFAAGLIIVFAFVITKPNLYSFFIKSLNDRLVYVNVSRGTIRDNPVLGIGNGQFVINMQDMPIIKENWILQPVHNVFLLVWSELGVIGFGLLIWFMLYIFRTLWYGTITNIKSTFGAIFIGLLFIMFFDHYLWDIQQGSFLLWMTLGFLVGAGEYKENIDKI